MAGILFIISAPSGSGKSTLVAQLRTLVEGLDFSVSYTTRAPRGSETDGREYHFVERATFEGMIERGEFFEWALVFGNYYGTACSALDHARAAGKDLLLDIDVQGAKQVMQKLPAAVSIFILPPSPQVLEMRLRQRSEAEHMTLEAVIERRLHQAQTEVEQVWDYKYALVNDVLDVATAELRAIVLYERGVLDQQISEMKAPIYTDGRQLSNQMPAENIIELAKGCLTSARPPKLKAVLKSFGIS